MAGRNSIILLLLIFSAVADAGCVRIVKQLGSEKPMPPEFGYDPNPKGDNYQALKKAVPVDSLFEIYGASFPRGKDGGALWHIRPRKGAQKIAQMDGLRYTLLQPMGMFGYRQAAYDYFGRRVGNDEALGWYWKTRESPELYETLRNEWNKSKDPDQQVHLKLRTTGPDSQIQMAKLRAEKEPVVGVASPFDDSFYIPNSEKNPKLNPKKFKVNPKTSRVPQISSLAAHDWREIDSALWISKPINDEMQLSSQIWLQIHQLLKKNKKLPTATDEASKQLAKRFLDYAKENKRDKEAQLGVKGFSSKGAQWWRLAEIEIYKNQRTFHSFNHLLIHLMENTGGLAQDWDYRDEGPIQQRELDLHRWGLGNKTGEPPHRKVPLVMLTYEGATDARPLTLTKAVDKVFNGERQRLEDFAKRVPDPDVKTLIRDYLRRHPARSRGQISRIAKEQANR